ncbi:hypothetical protein DRO54_06315 [Candidatus Bathyarchaeota archaeon]|nr:MAG: hypothetical protein DRO54_06315 [Candidatus Bathyarchaeota archaeon]
MSRDKVYPLLFILIGLAIILHQLVFYGKVWEWKDALHHEVFAGLAIAFGLGIFVGRRLKS